MYSPHGRESMGAGLAPPPVLVEGCCLLTSEAQEAEK